MNANLAYAFGRRKGVLCSMILAASLGACMMQPKGDAPSEDVGSAASALNLCLATTPHSARNDDWWEKCSTAPTATGCAAPNVESATGTPHGTGTRTRCLPCGPHTVMTCSQPGVCTCTYTPPNKPVPLELEAGPVTSYVRVSDGTVYGWGSTEGAAIPVPDPSVLTTGVRTILGGATQISAGSQAGCAIVGPDDKVKCWGTFGANPFSQDPTWAKATEVPNVVNAVSLTQGNSHACALNANGEVLCWGADDDGELGDGQSGPGVRRDEGAVVAGLPKVAKVVAGYRTTCALGVDKMIYCWGYNGPLGQLGLGSYGGSQPTPVRLGSPDAPYQATDLQGGGNGTFCIDAIAPTHERLCWGDNTNGQATRQLALPARAPTPVANAAAYPARPRFKAGAVAACDFEVGNPIECWGANAKNQLLLKDMAQRTTTPVSFTDVSGPTLDLAMGDSHMCQAWGPYVKCWGNNDHGQVGGEPETGANDASPVHDVILPMGKVDIGTGQTSLTSWTQGAYGYVWYDGGNAATHPAGQYNYNSADGENRVIVISRGRYVVEMPGLDDPGGMAIVSAHGSTAARCKTVGWGPANGVLNIEVRCHDAAGAPVNSRFVLSYYQPSLNPLEADLVTNADLSSANQTPDYSWNSRGGANTLEHLAKGSYRVVLPKMGTTDDYGNLFVQAYGADASYCKPERWAPSGTSVVAIVDCFDKAGAATDTRFALSFFVGSVPSPGAYGAYAYTANESSASYRPDAHYQSSYWEHASFDGDTMATSTRSAAGHYETSFPFVGDDAGILGHAMAVGASSDYCVVSSFGGNGNGAGVIDLLCFDKDGNASDSPYVTRYLSTFKPSKLGK
jgi:hypothetical protein